MVKGRARPGKRSRPRLGEFGGNVGQVGIEDGVTFRLPPKPILDDGIKGNMLLAVAMRDAQHFILGHVTVFRLNEPIGPRRSPRIVSGVDDLVHFRTINEVVIHGMAGERTQVQFQGKPIPHQRVALARHEQRDRDIGVVLREIDAGTAVIEQSTLMLSQPVEPLVEAGREPVFKMKGLLVV